MAQHQNQNQSSEDQIVQNVVECIRMTQSGNLPMIKEAERRLESQHTKPRFGPLLLRLLTQNIDASIKLGAAIYFKNYVKKYWGMDEDIISQQDQQFIKTAIVRVMLQSDKNSQRQISEAITIIASHDFWAKWDTLLPELIDKIKTEQNFENICGVLRIIESITCRYPDKEKTLDMINEIKYILELFQDIWLTILQKWSQPIIEHFSITKSNANKSGPPQQLLQGGKNGVNQIKYQIQSVEQLILIFFDLNSVDLIAFFENHMVSWAKIYESLLSTTDKFNIFGTADDSPGPIDNLRTAIVRALKLFNSKYEEEYSKFVPSFVQNVCHLLTTINDDERYDHLAAESIGYLSSVACQQWNANLFSSTQILNDIVQRILIRNIRLRDSDINMYEMNGEDWIRRDMEGSDLYTRRRGAVDLIRGLSQHFEADISTIIISHVQELMNRYKENPKENFIDKDTAINLILAISIKGSTKLCGATKLNAHVDVKSFFSKHILPEFTGQIAASHSLILSDCLKFIIIFRSQWPMENFLGLLPMALKYLQKEDYVLHTYAAIAIDKILAMKDVNMTKPKYPKDLLLKDIDKVLIALFTVLNTRQESFTNEYVMKCIMRVILRAEDGCIKVIEPIIKQCSQILLRQSKNPQKPLFNHYLFECIAALINYICDKRYNVNNQPSNISKFEQVLMGPFLKILDMEQASEFHPYIYQIIALMLRTRNSVNTDYESLFDKLLSTSLWNNDGNIVAISGTFADYLRIVKIEKFMNERRLTGLLGIFQHLLSKRTQDYYAFLILRAIFQYIPLSILKNYLQTIIQLICHRIGEKKSSALCCGFIVSLSIFIYKNGLSPLIACCNQIQQNIFAMILEKVWLVFARNVTDLTDRKILTIAMIKMCNDAQSFRSNANLFKFYPDVINVIVQIFEAGPLKSNEQKTMEFYISALTEQGAGNKFVGLNFAKSPTHDITKNEKDPRQLLLESLVNVLGGNNNQQIKKQFAAQTKPIICKTINQYATKFNVNFSLPVNSN